MATLNYSIDEIAKWEANREVDIPALQRGLVWSPRQVELLWDSILRGFPIGAFVFTPVSGNEEQLTSNGEEHAKYFLLDGQQRYNAIKSAFTKHADGAKSVLWVDFMPPTKTNSTRRFWIKVTTQAHPWGFANNDDCSTLGWAEYRRALERYGYSAETLVQDVQMSRAWPIEAGSPVPFVDVKSMFADANGDVGLFRVLINEWIAQHPQIGCDGKDIKLIDATAKSVFEAFERCVKYSVVAFVLEPKTLADSGNPAAQDDVVSSGFDFEHLFTRINTLGEPISPYDLRYSAIKAYWGDIKNANDRIAEEIMPAANLAVLAFRLALSIKGENGVLADVPSVGKIRQMGLLRDDVACVVINELYADDGELLEGIVKDVDEHLNVFRRGMTDYDRLPAVIRTSIIVNSPDIYLLLMYVSYCGMWDALGNAVGLATWLHWFTVHDRKNILDALRMAVGNGDESDVKRVLDTACKDGLLLYPVPSQEFGGYEQFMQKEMNWGKYESEECRKWYPVFDRAWHEKELVCYAVRRYFNRIFQYDPAETKFFTGHNRPWDWDHVIPKSWVSRQGVEMGEWKRMCQDWIWSIGNFAPILFTSNRRKKDCGDWSEYEDNAKDLFFDERIKKLHDIEMTKSDAQASLFVQITFERLCKIYEDWRVSAFAKTMGSNQGKGMSLCMK